MLRVFVVCYLVCLLAAVRHFLNGHHLIVAHISGLLTTDTHTIIRTLNTQETKLFNLCDISLGMKATSPPQCSPGY